MGNYETYWEDVSAEANMENQPEGSHEMSEKSMITYARRWAKRCETHAGEEVQNGVVYIWFLLQQLADLEVGLKEREAENEALQNGVRDIRSFIDNQMGDSDMLHSEDASLEMRIIWMLNALLKATEDEPS